MLKPYVGTSEGVYDCLQKGVNGGLVHFSPVV